MDDPEGFEQEDNGISEEESNSVEEVSDNNTDVV